MLDTIYVAINPSASSNLGAVLPILLSALAFAVSLVAVWKTHFSRFSPVFAVGALTLRVYPIKDETNHWFIASALLPFTVSNNGARPGFISGMRLVVRYPKLPIQNNYEVFTPTFEIDPTDLGAITKLRFKWIAEVATHAFTPFVCLPKEAVCKALIFETRWDHPVIQSEIEFALEVFHDATKTWVEIDRWMHSLSKSTWVEMTTNGSGYSVMPSHHPTEQFTHVHPADLHKYTGTEDDLSQVLVEVPSSRLDFPDLSRQQEGRRTAANKRQTGARTLRKRRRN